jgi:hypothetical protein
LAGVLPFHYSRKQSNGKIKAIHSLIVYKNCKMKKKRASWLSPCEVSKVDQVGALRRALGE